MSFGYILKTLRISAGISLRELARSIEVSPTYLSLVENEKQPPPSCARITQIEEALEAPRGYLLAIVNGLNPDLTLFVRQEPEVADFFKVAKQKAMSSTDFMELTGYLRLHGWEKMKQALERPGVEPSESLSDPAESTGIGPFVWTFLDEKLVFDMVDVNGKAGFFEEAVSRICNHCTELEPDTLLRELLDRERAASTGIGSGVALPHVFLAGIEQTIAALLRIPGGLEFEAIDGEPVFVALLLAGPRDSENTHLGLLARIAKLLGDKAFCEDVLRAGSPREIISIFRREEMKNL